MSETTETISQAQNRNEPLNLQETGAVRDGTPQVSTKRLFLQLQVFGSCADPAPFVKAFQSSGFEGVLYRDLNDPQGIGVVFIAEQPERFIDEIRSLLTQKPFLSLCLKPDMTITGRTYSTGREINLEDWLLERPRRAALNPQWPWAIWYPLRRKPEFELLSRAEQGKILMEHAMIGRRYGEAGYAQDIRLACHGLDKNDNEFVLGLVGAELYPLSRLVQDMRKTEQTARYIQSLGPFFVGKALYMSPHRQ